MGTSSKARYRVDRGAHDPRPLRGRPIAHGGIEIAFPRIPIRKALLPLAVIPFLLAWSAGWLQRSNAGASAAPACCVTTSRRTMPAGTG